mmetsp:Transcript_59631/g.169653  ORF Transcript_59631/g.169653 Transcript_59631/m.169653 type:complete len:376 (-) Transcript_59631:18-1145(-)
MGDAHLVLDLGLDIIDCGHQVGLELAGPLTFPNDDLNGLDSVLSQNFRGILLAMRCLLPLLFLFLLLLILLLLPQLRCPLPLLFLLLISLLLFPLPTFFLSFLHFPSLLLLSFLFLPFLPLLLLTVVFSLPHRRSFSLFFPSLFHLLFLQAVALVVEALVVVALALVDAEALALVADLALVVEALALVVAEALALDVALALVVVALALVAKALALDIALALVTEAIALVFVALALVVEALALDESHDLLLHRFVRVGEEVPGRGGFVDEGHGVGPAQVLHHRLEVCHCPCFAKTLVEVHDLLVSSLVHARAGEHEGFRDLKKLPLRRAELLTTNARSPDSEQCRSEPSLMSAGMTGVCHMGTNEARKLRQHPHPA